MNTTMQRILVSLRSPLLWTTLTAALAACSSSSSPATSGDGGTPKADGGGASKDGGTTKDVGTKGADTGAPADPVATFCAALIAAEAKAAAQCVGGPEALWAAQLSNSTACSQLSAAVAAGRVTFDSTQASSCLTTAGTVDCATFSSGTEPTACAAALKGTVASGGTCYSGVDCVSPMFCNGLGGATRSCSGTCMSPVAASASCTIGGAPCVAGYFCAGSPATCTANPTPAALGQTCIYDTSTMMGAPPCQTGLACDLTTFTCVTPVVEGKACEPGHGTCATFSYCDPTSKTCKQDPGAGGKCGVIAGEDPIVCLGPTYCKPNATGSTAGTCAALSAPGASCTTSAECATRVCSGPDGGTHTCAPACSKE